MLLYFAAKSQAAAKLVRRQSLPDIVDANGNCKCSDLNNLA